MRDDQVAGPQIPRSATNHNGSRSSVPSPLKARVAFLPAFLGDNWIIDHHDFTCLLPIASAAAELRDFYEDIAVFAALTDLTPSRHFRIWAGDITLEVMAPVGQNVQWIAIQGFANWMVELTRRGYVNTYQVNFINRVTGSLLTFSLWVGYNRARTEVPW